MRSSHEWAAKTFPGMVLAALGVELTQISRAALSSASLASVTIRLLGRRRGMARHGTARHDSNRHEVLAAEDASRSPARIAALRKFGSVSRRRAPTYGLSDLRNGDARTNAGGAVAGHDRRCHFLVRGSVHVLKVGAHLGEEFF